MKKILLYLACIILCNISILAQNEWYEITSSIPVSYKSKLLSSANSEAIVQFDIEGFYFQETPAIVSKSKIISVPKSPQIMEKGMPDLPKLTASVVIPNKNSIKCEIVFSNYIEIADVNIAPSKGNLYRDVNPDDIPFTYNNVYQQNEWYPNKLVDISEPYIIRDTRGIVISAYPFQYNPVKKVLRIYYSLTVKVFEIEDENAINELSNSSIRQNEDFNYLYKHHFLNYSTKKYTPLKERGRILVIAYDEYAPYMQDYVNWKNQIGFPTEIVLTSEIGQTPAKIKEFVQVYYDKYNDFAYLLLVGDNQHIGAFSNTTGLKGPSDANYGYLAGNDHYPDIYVGRFSAESVKDVQTQVQRTIEYERAYNFEENWLNKGLGIARYEGAGQGHNGEADCEHIDLIREKLLNYTYDDVYQEYDNTSGSTACGVSVTSAAKISQKINSGASIINYCNHGAETGWSVGNYSNSHVNALTNIKKLPFIISVACVNGNFTRTGGPCFAETWLRATYNGEPTGAVATYMSTINQSWIPPMDAHDAMIDVLTEMYANNIKRSIGGVFISGAMNMNDKHASAGYEMTDTWTIFGDPSLMIRTDNPKLMQVKHEETIQMNEEYFTVQCNVEDAFVTLTTNFQIIGTGIIKNGSCQIQLPELDVEDTVLVTITAFNYIPYEQLVPINSVTLAIDMQVLAVIELQEFYPCANVPIKPKFVVRNTGIETIKSFQLNYQINSQAIVKVQWEGNLASLEKDTIDATSSIVLPEGKHSIKFFISKPNNTQDLNTSNDSLFFNFEIEDLPIFIDFSSQITEFCNIPATISFENKSQNMQKYLWLFGDGNISEDESPTHIYNHLGKYDVILIADAGVCGKYTLVKEGYITIGLEQPQMNDISNCGATSVSIETDAIGEVNWYNVNQELIYVGNNFTTPLLEETTTYYVESSISETANGGKTDNTSGGGGYFNSAYVHGLVFNCNEPVILKSVKVYANTAGNRTITLENSLGTVLQSKSIYMPKGESRVELNFDIPVGENLKLLGPTTPNLWRNGSNTAGNLGYPFIIGDFISITESTATDYETYYYYYFYEWEVEQLCKSPLTQVNVFIQSNPEPNFTYTMENNAVVFENQTEGLGATYYWDFGDGNTSTLENPIHFYDNIGNYVVILNVTNSCGEGQVQKEVSVITGNIKEENATDVLLYPIPASDYLYIESPENIEFVELFQYNGQIVLSKKIQDTKYKLNLASLEGVFYLKIHTNNSIISKPLTIIK